MSKSKVLIQLDTDGQVSSFDSIVALDAGVDQLLTYSNVKEDEITGLIHGAMFTRGPKDLKNSAAFFGGSDVSAVEALIQKAKSCFFGPIRVSLMADPNGSNTTAAAAVICAEKHLELKGNRITILGGTGPVGQRIAKLVIRSIGPEDNETLIRIGSRSQDKANAICEQLNSASSNGIQVEPLVANETSETLDVIAQTDILFAAGAAGVQFVDETWKNHPVKVAVDINAVPPLGLEGIESTDQAKNLNDTICYGAIGVGGLKMKIHRRAIEMLFESNDLILDTDAIYDLGKSL